MRKYFSLLFLLLSVAVFAQQPKTHTVIVKPDGSFEPKWTYIHDGDTVKWQFSARTDAIIPVHPLDSLAVSCSAYKPYEATNPNEFTGPLPRAASGIYTLGPDGEGFVIETRGMPNPTCDYLRSPAQVGNQYLCPTGANYATMDWTWQNPNLTGVFIRLRWDEVNPALGVYDWTAMDREIEQAVRNGKLYSLSFKAGAKGTPQWIFDPAIAGANVVKRLSFQDDDDESGCGVKMDLGSPADPNYRRLYFDLWKAAAQRIRSRNAWFRALAYVKPSGANLFSHENRLPNGCETGCICNPQVWAEQGGYTPKALYEFYSLQTAMLAAEFPGKEMSYQLIQAGFPLVNDNGEHKEPLTTPLPRGSGQTEKILAQGRHDHGLRFIVQHNGLGPKPQDQVNPKPPCPNEGKHPAVRPFGGVGSGCPNRWVLEEGEAGQITGFQTNNANGVANAIELESTLQNAWDNSDAIFVEIYEQRFWEAEVGGPVLNPRASGRTIADWANLFHQRRQQDWSSKLGEAFPLTHRHVFKRTISSRTANQLFYYVNPAKCGAGNTAKFGAIVILPNTVTSVSESAETPASFALQQNYPNPFSANLTAGTVISFQLPAASEVSVAIYSMNGQLVKQLANGRFAGGAHQVTWDGNDDAGRRVANGNYFYQLVAGELQMTKRLLLLK